MPRRSVADQLIPRVDGRAVTLRPPARLKGEARQVLAELAQAVAPGHFLPGDMPLLEAYANTVALAREAAVRLREDGAVTGGKPSPWLAILDRCNRALVPMAQKLRLCPSARQDRKRATAPDMGPVLVDFTRLPRRED